MKNLNDLIQGMQARGLCVSRKKFNTSGKLERVPTISKPHKQNAWCSVNKNGNFINAVFGNYETSETFKWSNREKDNNRKCATYSASLQVNYRKNQEQEQQDKLSKLRSNYSRLVKPLTRVHPYLHSKELSELLGLCIADSLGRTPNNDLVIPMRGINGNLMGFQTIDKDGKKRFALGSQKKGNFYTLASKNIGLKDSDVVFICEGFGNCGAIYLSVNELLDSISYSCVTAFDVGNIEPVVLNIWGKYPNKSIVLVADNDYESDINIGVETCSAIINKYRHINNISLVIPEVNSHGRN